MKAKEGYYYRNKYTNESSQEVTLGKASVIKDGKVQTVNLTKNDFELVRRIFIEGNEYFVASDSYADIVTELIRKKYTLNDELAIMANSRLGNTSQEDQFQHWRSLCKEAAKQLVNE